jgi:hypothetical protein
MMQKVTKIFLTSLLITALIWTSTTLGSDRPYQRLKDRMAVPARLAPVYSFPGADQSEFATAPGAKSSNQIALGTLGNGNNPTSVGITYYDYQHNGSMGRQAEHRGTNYLNVDWMWLGAGVLGGERDIYYQAYNLSTCTGDNHPPLFAVGGANASGTDRAGYCTIDVNWANGCAIPGAHQNDLPGFTHPNAFWDLCSGAPFNFFSADSPTDYHGWVLNNGTGTGVASTDNPMIWPKIDWQIGTATVLHMVAAETGTGTAKPQTISYYRRVGPYGTGSGVWSGQRVIDSTLNIAPVVTSDRTSDKVAIVWVAPVDFRVGTTNEYGGFAVQYCNDVWYAISTNQGAEWSATPTTSPASHSINYDIRNSTPGYTGGNITAYTVASDWKAYTDLSALITSDHKLHVVWNTRRWTDTTSLYRRQAALWHWSEGGSISPIVKAMWDTGGTCAGYAWGSDCAKPSISECDGKLYVLYTQFGDKNHPCDHIGAGKQVVNGFMYMSVSSDGGVKWDRARAVSGQAAISVWPCTEGTSGTCGSEYWASSSRFGRLENCGDTLTGKNVLDVLFINDKAPGGCVQPESGVWAANPVMWLRAVCRPVVPEALYNDDAGTGYGECYSKNPLVVLPNPGDTTVVLHMENTGLLPNPYTVSIAWVNGSGWLIPDKLSGTIPSGGTDNISLHFVAPVGAPDPSTWKCTLTITNASVDDSPRNIPICMVVASNFVYPKDVVLATACKRIRLYNTGRLSNNGSDMSLDLINDCDTFNANTNAHIYLYDGSPIVCRIKGTDTLRFMGYSRAFTDNDAFRPLSQWVVDSSGPAYQYARSTFCTADSAIGFKAEYYVPIQLDSCCFMIEKLRFYNRTAAPIAGVLVGEFLDWDVPSDSGSNNSSDFDLTRNMIYQIGAEYGADDSTENLCVQHQQADQRMAGIALDSGVVPKNAMTIDNATYVYTSGPYKTAAPLPKGVMYSLMKTKTGFSKYTTTKPESLRTDLSTLMTFGEYTLPAVVGGNTDTSQVIKIIFTTKGDPDGGLQELIKNLQRAWRWLKNHPEIKGSCCNKAGDANNDTKVNVGDAVFMINYVFKAGPAPSCKAQGDANADTKLNVGDAVYLINFVFKAGPAPKCGP